MGRKIDAKTAGELNELLHGMMVAIGRASGVGPVKIVNKYDLTFPQIIVLGTLERGPQTVSSLSEVLQLTRGAVSRLVERMVRKGLVSRREGDGDRRQKTLSLTPAGQRIRDQLDTVRVSGFVAALSELDSALAADLKDVLTRVVATLRPRSSATER
jgi:DNA-binding MarR family transcriptional regulator